MGVRYGMTVKSAKETIEFKAYRQGDGKDDAPGTTYTADCITGVRFGFDSNNDLKDRDKDGKIVIKVYGVFNGQDDDFTAIKQLSDWAKSRQDIYREVTIVMTTDGNSSSNGNFQRTYHFDRMYCVDYFENSGAAVQKEEGSYGIEFTLLMAQSPTYRISETKAEKI